MMRYKITEASSRICSPCIDVRLPACVCLSLASVRSYDSGPLQLNIIVLAFTKYHQFQLVTGKLLDLIVKWIVASIMVHS